MELPSVAASKGSQVVKSRPKRRPLLSLLGLAAALTLLTCGTPTTALRLRDPKFDLSDLKLAIKNVKQNTKPTEDADEKARKARKAADKATGSNKAKLQEQAEKAKHKADDLKRALGTNCSALQSALASVESSKLIPDKNKKDAQKLVEEGKKILLRCWAAVKM